MIAGLLGLASEAIGLIQNKEATKYSDKFIKLQKKYYKELNATPNDHAVLDNLEKEIADLVTATTSFLKDLKK